MTLRFEVALKFDDDVGVNIEEVRRGIEATLEMEYYPGSPIPGSGGDRAEVYPSDVEVSVL